MSSDMRSVPDQKRRSMIADRGSKEMRWIYELITGRTPLTVSDVVWNGCVRRGCRIEDQRFIIHWFHSRQLDVISE